MIYGTTNAEIKCQFVVESLDGLAGGTNADNESEQLQRNF